jgi:hypothetical protein
MVGQFRPDIKPKLTNMFHANIDKEFILKFKEADFDNSGRISFHIDLLSENWKTDVFKNTIRILELVKIATYSEFNVLPEATIQLDKHNDLKKEDIKDIIFTDFSLEEIDSLVVFTPPDIIINTKAIDTGHFEPYPWFLNRKLESLSTEKYNVFHTVMYDKRFDEFNSYLRINMIKE